MSLTNPATIMSLVSQAAPQPGPTAQVAPTDIIGPIMAKWQGEMENARLANQAKQALMGSVFGLAGSGLGAWGLRGFPMRGTMLGNALGMSPTTPTPASPGVANLTGSFMQGTDPALWGDATGAALGTDALAAAGEAGIGSDLLASLPELAAFAL